MTTGPDDELEVLFPDRDVEVRDPDTGSPVTVTVREFRFREGLEAQVEARPLIEALTSMTADDVSPLGGDAVIGAHPDIWIGLIARATDRDPEWIARLDGASGFALDRAMWAVNAGFFIRPAVKAARPETDLASRYLSVVSSIRSLPRATAAKTGTGESPSGSPSGKSGSSTRPPKRDAPKQSQPAA